MKQIILMADIINSRSHPSLELLKSFKELVLAVNTNFSNELLSPLTITLGDEYQAIVKELNDAVRMLIFIEEYSIQHKLDFKLRHVLKEGEVETEINKQIAHGMLGSGLTEARAALLRLKKTDNRFRIEIEKKPSSDLFNHAFQLFQSIIDEWRPNMDYELVSRFIKEGDYKLVAMQLGKTRSQVWKREKTLKMSNYQHIKSILEIASKQ
jgi:SatD family (SatD)